MQSIIWESRGLTENTWTEVSRTEHGVHSHKGAWEHLWQKESCTPSSVTKSWNCLRSYYWIRRWAFRMSHSDSILWGGLECGETDISKCNHGHPEASWWRWALVLKRKASYRPSRERSSNEVLAFRKNSIHFESLVSKDRRQENKWGGGYGPNEVSWHQ